MCPWNARLVPVGGEIPQVDDIDVKELALFSPAKHRRTQRRRQRLREERDNVYLQHLTGFQVVSVFSSNKPAGGSIIIFFFSMSTTETNRSTTGKRTSPNRFETTRYTSLAG